MKNHFRGSMGTLVVLMDGLVLAIVVIGLFWYAGRSTVEASASHTDRAPRAMTIEPVG